MNQDNVERGEGDSCARDGGGNVVEADHRDVLGKSAAPSQPARRPRRRPNRAEPCSVQRSKTASGGALADARTRSATAASARQVVAGSLIRRRVRAPYGARAPPPSSRVRKHLAPPSPSAERRWARCEAGRTRGGGYSPELRTRQELRPACRPPVGVLRGRLCSRESPAGVHEAAGESITGGRSREDSKGDHGHSRRAIVPRDDDRRSRERVRPDAPEKNGNPVAPGQLASPVLARPPTDRTADASLRQRLGDGRSRNAAIRTGSGHSGTRHALTCDPCVCAGAKETRPPGDLGRAVARAARRRIAHRRSRAGLATLHSRRRLARDTETREHPPHAPSPRPYRIVRPASWRARIACLVEKVVQNKFFHLVITPAISYLQQNLSYFALFAPIAPCTIVRRRGGKRFHAHVQPTRTRGPPRGRAKDGDDEKPSLQPSRRCGLSPPAFRRSRPRR